MVYREKTVKMPALLWKRVVAYFIDVFILLLVASPLKGFWDYQDSSIFESYEALASNAENISGFLPIGLFIAALTLFYFTFLEFRFGQTFGKMVMGLYVISAVKKERHFEHFLVRNLSKISTLFLLIDSIPIIFHNSNQRYLERFAGTFVIQEGIGVK